LIPEQKTGDVLSGLIEEFGERFQTSVFRPHLTLLGQLQDDIAQILPLFSQLGETGQPLILQSESVAFENFYFRALFYKIRAVPDLLAFHSKAWHMFGRDLEPPFFPHISLLYSLASEKEKAVGLSALRVPEQIDIPIASLELVKTEGDVESWKTVARINI